MEQHYSIIFYLCTYMYIFISACMYMIKYLNYYSYKSQQRVLRITKWLCVGIDEVENIFFRTDNGGEVHSTLLVFEG